MNVSQLPSPKIFGGSKQIEADTLNLNKRLAFPPIASKDYILREGFLGF